MAATTHHVNALIYCSTTAIVRDLRSLFRDRRSLFRDLIQLLGARETCARATCARATCARATCASGGVEFRAHWIHLVPTGDPDFYIKAFKSQSAQVAKYFDMPITSVAAQTSSLESRV